MLQRLPIAFAHVKARNTSEDLLNEIHILSTEEEKSQKLY